MMRYSSATGMAAERILVVDDEESIREIVSSMLSFANYQCRQAASGREALALLDSGETFELMLSDLMMAELDGIALLERSKEKYPDMPVIMVTAVHDISVALAAIRNGAYDYLLNPLSANNFWPWFAGHWSIAASSWKTGLTSRILSRWSPPARNSFARL